MVECALHVSYLHGSAMEPSCTAYGPARSVKPGGCDTLFCTYDCAGTSTFRLQHLSRPPSIQPVCLHLETAWLLPGPCQNLGRVLPQKEIDV